ncbi:MAG: TIGR03067 domain-containing protein [Isosphaeraceae bacterium]|nr:TIGR03067 domain-containing protein [Isosphaeraceae bacterium]
MRTLLAALILIAAPAPAPADDKPQGDLAKLQGIWKALAGPEKNIPIVLEIKDKTVRVTVTPPEGEERSLKGEIKIDETKTPKHWDWIKFQRADGDEAPPNLAIYKFEGDRTLVICNGGPGNERPTEFQAGEMGRPSLLTFTKQDEEKKGGQ